MFDNLRLRLRDMGTVKLLCEQAERHALADGQRHPGAEHFLLAAFDLPDGTAAQAFLAAGADPDGFREAILTQYRDALAHVGCEDGTPSADVVPTRAPIFDAAASGQEVMQRLAEDRGHHRPLLGAHVVEVVAGMKYGIAARALSVMSVDREALRQTAAGIISAAGKR